MVVGGVVEAQDPEPVGSAEGVSVTERGGRWSAETETASCARSPLLVSAAPWLGLGDSPPEKTGEPPAQSKGG